MPDDCSNRLPADALANERHLQMLAHLVRDPWQTVSAIADQMQLSLPAVSLYRRALEARGFLQA